MQNAVLLAEFQLLVAIGPANGGYLFGDAAEALSSCSAMIDRDVGVTDDGKIVNEQIELVSVAQTEVFAVTLYAAGLCGP